MGIKLTVANYETHPEGWHPFAIKSAVADVGKFGPTIKWEVVSKLRGEDGKPLTLQHTTSQTLSPQSKVMALATACGIDIDEELDTDEWIGRQFEGLIVHKEGEKGTWANITEVRPIKRQKGKAKPEPADEGEEFRDPFADE